MQEVIQHQPNAVATMAAPLDFMAAAVQTFAGVQQLADLMAKCGTLPAHLQGKPADCFRVVVQAAKWRMDPFAVAECTSLVHGKMCYEGKLVHAVLLSMGAIKQSLNFEYDGKEGSEARSVLVSGVVAGERKGVRGTVADWKTTGNGSPWKPGAYDRQLAYRGTREWARMWAPAALLGVHTPDEQEVIRDAEATVRSEPQAARVGASDPMKETEKPVEKPRPAGHPAVEAGKKLHSVLKDRHGAEEANGILVRLCKLNGAAKLGQVAPDRLDRLGQDVAALGEIAQDLPAVKEKLEEREATEASGADAPEAKP